MAKGNLVIPKFRFENAVLIVAVRFFRWTFFLLYGLAIGWINTHPLPPNSFNFAGNLKYLTYWNLIAQFALYSLINYCDIFLSNNDRAIVSRANVLTKLRDLLHQGVAFPVGMFVAITFWTVYAIDPELIYPLSTRPYYPEWLNHITHTLVGVTPLFEETVYYYPRDNRKAFITLYSYLAVYFLWFIYLGYIINHWVYPVVRVVPDVYKLPFVLSFGLVFLAIFSFINYYHTKLWPIKARKKTKTT